MKSLSLVLLVFACAPLGAQVSTDVLPYRGRVYQIVKWQPDRPTCPAPDYILPELHNCIPNRPHPDVRYQVVEIGKREPHVWGPDENNWCVATFYARPEEPLQDIVRRALEIEREREDERERGR